MTTVGPAALDVRVLGPIEVARDGSVRSLGGPRQQALLALLASEAGRVITSDRLIEELWAGEPPDGAEVTLRSYISRLRSALGDGSVIRAAGDGYALELDRDQIDAARFERHVREAQSHLGRRHARQATMLLQEALQAWRGRPFGGLGRDGVLRIESERLDELRLHAIELRVEADLALGLAGAIVDELEALVRDHPYREAFWRQLMLALYRSERQADALAAYHRARTALDEHLGIEPGEELERLQGQILRHEVPPASPPEARHNLPAPLTSFIGRQVELAEVAHLLETSRLVTLVGVGGVGKTRLAQEAARARVADHPDGVYFVDLAPLGDHELVAGHVASTLGIREQATISPADRLGTHLRTADVLLVLDNCEHLRAACADLASRLLRSCPELKLLATSREVLGVPGETGYAVPPLGLPGAAAPTAVWRESESVRLFLARAREARPGIPDDDTTIETIGRICSDLDGLPLAIELAAARARALSPAEIAARLRDRYRFLVSWRRLAAARHRTLREAMDWSYSLLEPDEQRVLRGLSVFAGGFTLDAVAAVCTDGDEEGALQRLERLVEASLVIVDSAQDPTRYRILETVRQYGAEQLVDAGEQDELRRRHAAHYTAFAEAAWSPLLPGWIQAAAVERIGHERENLRATLTWQQEASEYDAMLTIADAVWPFWWVRGELTEGRFWLETALEHAPASDPGIRAQGHLGVGGLAWAQTDYDAAEKHATAARALFAELGDTLREGSALNTLGLIANGRNDNERARSLFEASIRRYRDVEAEQGGVDRYIAITIDNLGSVAHDVGDDEAALGHYREALAMNRARNDAEGVAMNELHIAVLTAEAGRLEEARGLLAGALAVYWAVGFGQYAAECLETSSIVANGSGSPDHAAFLLGAAARIRDDAGAPPVPFMARLRIREAAIALAALGPETFEALTDDARRMSSEAALQRAIDYLGQPATA